MPTTPLGLPYPDEDDDNDVPGHLRVLAEFINDDVLGPDGIVIPLAQDSAADYLASQPGVVAAATTAAGEAVGEAVQEAGILGGVRYLPPWLSELLGAVLVTTDQEGRRTWLEVGPDGGPTPHARLLLGAGGYPVEANPATGYAVYWHDRAGRIPLAVRVDGSVMIPRFDALTVENLAEQLGVAGGGNAIAYPGDSLTPDVAALSTAVGGRPVLNYGYGGQGSESITARLGSSPSFLTVQNNTIPANGGVSVTAWSKTLGVGVYAGSLAGVPGTLTISNGGSTQVFARTQAGAAQHVPPLTPFVTSVHTRGLQLVSAMGRNGGWGDANSRAQLIADTKANMAWAGPNAARSLVLDIAPWLGEELGTNARNEQELTNAALRANFPAQYTNAFAQLRSTVALAHQGITPTATDLDNITKGLTPVSFRSDEGHLNEPGRTELVRIIADALQAREATS